MLNYHLEKQSQNGLWIDGFCGPKSSKAPWDVVKLLKSGLAPSCRAPPPKYKRADGTFATTPEEVANVFSTHFSALLYYPFL